MLNPRLFSLIRKEFIQIVRDPRTYRETSPISLTRLSRYRATGASRAATVVWHPQYQHIARQKGM